MKLKTLYIGLFQSASRYCTKSIEKRVIGALVRTKGPMVHLRNIQRGMSKVSIRVACILLVQRSSSGGCYVLHIFTHLADRVGKQSCLYVHNLRKSSKRVSKCTAGVIV